MYSTPTTTTSPYTPTTDNPTLKHEAETRNHPLREDPGQTNLSATQAVPPKKGQSSVDEHNDTIGNFISAFWSALVWSGSIYTRIFQSLIAFRSLNDQNAYHDVTCKYIILQENKANSWKVSLQSFIGSWSGTPHPDLVHDRIAAFDTTTRNRIMNLECFDATHFFGWEWFLILHCWPGGDLVFVEGDFQHILQRRDLRFNMVIHPQHLAETFWYWIYALKWL